MNFLSILLLLLFVGFSVWGLAPILAMQHALGFCMGQFCLAMLFIRNPTL